MKLHSTGCPQCGEAISDIHLSQREYVSCPRCHHQLGAYVEHHPQKIIALSVTGLMFFAFMIVFPFMAINFKGLSHKIYLIDAVQQLIIYDHPLVASFFFIGVLLLPLVFLLGAASLFLRVSSGVLLRQHRLLCRGLFAAKNWLIADVFLVGVLVSLVKIGVLGQVTLYVGFYACFALILCLVMICVMMDKGNTWQYFSYATPKRVNGLCKVCHALGAKGGQCQRCGARIRPMDMNGMLQRSWAYLLTAFLLYMPANFLPMMVTVTRGQSESSTILGGVSLLWDMHSYGIALIILVASLVIPLAKMGILCTLYYQAGKKQKRPRWLIQKQTFWFHMTHVIGRWSFIDVFVVALLVALVQLNQVATILPGNAVVPFTAVVILTMLSAQAFDTRVLWLHEKDRYKHPVCSL